MKKIIIVLFIIAFNNRLYADTGIYQSYVVVNSGSNEYKASTDFNGFNIGTFNIGDSYLLNGGEIKTWKDNGGDITGAYLYYRIYKDGETASSYIEVSLPWAENNVDGSSNNQKWAKTNSNINILSGLTGGYYKIEVYFKATSNQGDRFSNNGGANYIANFTVTEPVDEIVLNGKVTISPSLPTRNEEVTITFDATGTALESSSKIYLHSGVGTDIPGSKEFNKTIGNWGADDGVGQMTQIGTTNEWIITFTTINNYFSLDSNEDAFGLNFLFRNETGSIKEDNLGSNYHLTLNPENFFIITDPTYNPFLVETNQNFAITAVANTSANYTLKELDENGVVINANINNQTIQNYSFNHSLSDIDVTHYYQLSVNFGSETKTKNFEVKSYGAITTASKPTGAKKGINYNLPNNNEITLVLHTPTNTTYTNFDSNNCAATSTATTESKKVVHLIGDFNNWEISDAYKLNKDGDYWWITINTTTLSPIQNEYVFQYLIDGQIKIGDPYASKVSDSEDQYIDADIYPDLISYPTGKTSGRATVLEVNKTPYTWKNPSFSRNVNSNDLNIYELHFRDFTEEGTYKAATLKLDYIKEMGINCIHVMPISEFEGNNSWGYNPNYYFAADKAYGTENDLKEFIDEAHSRGIAVVNDLVLNHAFYSNPMAMLYWDNENNKPAGDNPWFNPDHKGIYNSAGHWGADWNHASEHTRNMVDEILNYWIEEFKFDGFRFDFTKGFTQSDPDPSDEWASNYNNCRVEILKRMVSQMWTSHPNTYAIFEHLANDAEDKVLADHGILMWSGAGPQHSWAEMAMGTSSESFWSSVYDSRNFTFANYMSYMESHDEERIGYKVKTWGQNNDGSTKYLSNRLKLPAAFNLLLPGPRMIWQFEELGYDISIDDNGRTGDKPSAWELNYDLNSDRNQIYRFYQTIFKLRNTFNLYHAISDPSAISVVDYGNIGSTTEWVRRMSFSDAKDNGVHNQTQVIAVGNFNTTTDYSVNPGYYFTGSWFKYNGDPAVDGTKYTVNSTSDSFSLLKTDPVYILSNTDIISPRISPITINIDSPSACDYKISNGDSQYDYKQETWTANTAPTNGKASDNGTITELYYSKINGNTTLNKPTTLAGVSLEIGINKIEWVVTDRFGNTSSCEQTINVSTSISLPEVSLQTIDPIAEGSTATITIENPNANYTYEWFDSNESETPLANGTTYTTTILTESKDYWVRATENTNSCIGNKQLINVTVQSGTLGIEDEIISKHNIYTYPNPTTGNFKVHINSDYQSVQVELYSIQSRLVSSRKHEVINKNIELNLDDKPSGLYFIKIHLDQPITLKVLKK